MKCVYRGVARCGRIVRVVWAADGADEVTIEYAPNGYDGKPVAKAVEGISAADPEAPVVGQWLVDTGDWIDWMDDRKFNANWEIVI